MLLVCFTDCTFILLITSINQSINQSHGISVGTVVTIFGCRCPCSCRPIFGLVLVIGLGNYVLALDNTVVGLSSEAQLPVDVSY